MVTLQNEMPTWLRFSTRQELKVPAPVVPVLPSTSMLTALPTMAETRPMTKLAGEELALALTASPITSGARLVTEATLKIRVAEVAGRTIGGGMVMLSVATVTLVAVLMS